MGKDNVPSKELKEVAKKRKKETSDSPTKVQILHPGINSDVYKVSIFSLVTM